MSIKQRRYKTTILLSKGKYRIIKSYLSKQKHMIPEIIDIVYDTDYRKEVPNG